MRYKVYHWGFNSANSSGPKDERNWYHTSDGQTDFDAPNSIKAIDHLENHVVKEKCRWRFTKRKEMSMVIAGSNEQFTRGNLFKIEPQL
jgi:hypothetical protein